MTLSFSSVVKQRKIHSQTEQNSNVKMISPMDNRFVTGKNNQNGECVNNQSVRLEFSVGLICL